MYMQDAIDEIMDNFDFQKVHRAMKALKWEWKDVGVPEIADLKKFARRLLKDVIKNEAGGKISSGGFSATYTPDEKGQFLSLSFVLEHWEDYI